MVKVPEVSQQEATFFYGLRKMYIRNKTILKKYIEVEVIYMARLWKVYKRNLYDLASFLCRGFMLCFVCFFCLFFFLFLFFFLLKKFFFSLTLFRVCGEKGVLTLHQRGCPRGVMVKAMDCGIVVCEFVFVCYVHFRANTLEKGMNPLWIK